jgi:hypothetical protein
MEQDGQHARENEERKNGGEIKRRRVENGRGDGTGKEISRSGQSEERGVGAGESRGNRAEIEDTAQMERGDLRGGH